MFNASKLIISITAAICFGLPSIAQNLKFFKGTNSKYGFRDETGNVVIQPQFDNADWFSDNGLAPVKLNGKWGYIDKTGKFLIQPQFDDAFEFDNGLAAVKLNGKKGILMKKGISFLLRQRLLPLGRRWRRKCMA
jgi:hypothetical protein